MGGGLAPKPIPKTNKTRLGEPINHRLNDYMAIPRYRRPKEIKEE